MTGAAPESPIEFEPSRDLYPFASRWFDSAVGPVHYLDEGGGQPLLLLHGNPTWSFLYRHIVLHLRDRFRCIAPDYPGFGLSARPEGYGYTAAEHAEVIAALVEHLDLRDYVVMVQDWGGPIGLSVALRDPDRVAGIVAGNTWFWPFERWVDRAFSWVMGTGILQRQMLRNNFFVERVMPTAMQRELSEAEWEHYRQAQPEPRSGAAVFPVQLVEAREMLADLERRVPRLLGGKPLLLTWGMRDVAFPPAFLDRWRDAFPDHVVVKLDEARHYIQEDAPDRIADAIVRRFGPQGSHLRILD